MCSGLISFHTNMFLVVPSNYQIGSHGMPEKTGGAETSTFLRSHCYLPALLSIAPASCLKWMDATARQVLRSLRLEEALADDPEASASSGESAPLTLSDSSMGAQPLPWGYESDGGQSGAPSDCSGGPSRWQMLRRNSAELHPPEEPSLAASNLQPGDHRSMPVARNRHVHQPARTIASETNCRPRAGMTGPPTTKGNSPSLAAAKATGRSIVHHQVLELEVTNPAERAAQPCGAQGSGSAKNSRPGPRRESGAAAAPRKSPRTPACLDSRDPAATVGLARGSLQQARPLGRLAPDTRRASTSVVPSEGAHERKSPPRDQSLPR